MSVGVGLGSTEIDSLISHAYPFRLVDHVSQLVEYKSCLGTKYIGFNEPFFQGHFPKNPIMPGVLQVEAMAQAACALASYSLKSDGHDVPDNTLFASIDQAKFRKPVYPGCRMDMHIEVLRWSGKIAAISGKAFVNEDLVCEAQFKAAFWSSNEYTLSIIKPDAFQAGFAEDIIKILHINGLDIATESANGIQVLLKRRVKLSFEDAAAFYGVHSERPFFKDLCTFMSSGDCLVMVLKGHNAIARYREVMGATNPSQAAHGTIRSLYAKSIDENAVHGSDSLENAHKEINFFFPEFKKLSHSS